MKDDILNAIHDDAKNDLKRGKCGQNRKSTSMMSKPLHNSNLYWNNELLYLLFDVLASLIFCIT
jgi:hypothetical protein